MRLLALLVAAVALPCAAASASPPPAAPPPAAPSTPSSTTPPTAPPSSSPDEARVHYERGLAKYNLAEFDAAIVEFKQSYELSKAPRLLFNIAQAYRLKKDYESALYFYNTYLRADPNPPNLDDVDARIDEMKRALDDQRKAAAAPKPKPTPPPVAPAPPVDRRPSKRALKIGGATVAAIGLASCAVGAGMLGLSASDSNTLHRVATSGMPWTAADQAIFNEGDRAQLAGIVLLSAGGALVIAGGVTLITALRR